MLNGVKPNSFAKSGLFMLLKLYCSVHEYYVNVVIDTLVRFLSNPSRNYIVFKITYFPTLLNNSTSILFNATSVRT